MRSPKATSSSSSQPKTLSHLPSHHHDVEHRDRDSKLSIRRRSRWIPAMFERKRWRVRDIATAGLVVSILLYAANVALFTRYVDGKRCEYIYLRHVVTEYYNPNDCFSRADIQQIILGLVWALADVFEKNGIPYWLDSGTLLGSVREKTVIPHDYDADVGIDEATYLKLRDTDLKLDFPSVYELQVFEAKYRKHGNRDAGIPSRLVHTKSGMYVDIFVFLESRTPRTDPQPMFGPIPSSCFTDCVHCPKLAHGGYEFKIPKSWVFPLKQCMFGGRFVNCPAQPEKYLEHLYGSSYMTPDQ